MFRSAILFFFIHFDSLRALSRKCYVNIWIIWDGFENCRSISSNFMDIVGALYCCWPVSLEWIPTESGGYFSYAESPDVRTAREQKYSKIWKSIPKKALLNGFGVIILINWHAIIMNVVTIRLDIIILVLYDGCWLYWLSSKSQGQWPAKPNGLGCGGRVKSFEKNA